MRNLPGFLTRSSRPKHLLGILLLIGAPAACSAQTPHPPFKNESEYKRFIDYARKASFTPADGERRKLSIPGTARSVTASIEPVANIRRLSHVQRRSGAVLARIAADGDYPHMGVKAGTNFLYVDSVARAGWRTWVVPEKYTPTLTPRARAHGDRDRARKSGYAGTAGFIPDDRSSTLKPTAAVTTTAFMTDWTWDPELGCSCGRSSAELLCH
jgi:hypothetical protein